MFKKIPFVTLIIIVILTISITMLDFDDLSWSNNVKSYMGLIFSFIFLIIKITFKVR
jgi:hypothetical protein